MNLQPAEKTDSAHEKRMERCFRQMNDGAFDFFEADTDLAAGRMKQLSFENKFFVSIMDYSFRYATRKDYLISNQFLEVLYFESIKAENWEYGFGRFPLMVGVSTYINQRRPGKLVFWPDTPVRGVRIMIFEEFYLQYLRQHFSDNYLDIDSLIKMNNKGYHIPELQLVLKQIKRSMESDVSSELYYEGKILEILYMITAKAQEMLSSPRFHKRRLTEEDFAAVNKAKTILDERLSDSPKISELSRMTNTSAAKLQHDFQLAFGSTIHGYVLQVRMKEALHKLDSSNEPIYAIAKSVGCKNPGRFAELFKKVYGITPTEYRKLKNNC
jgi:AraC-like DNA-binding protein